MTPWSDTWSIFFIAVVFVVCQSQSLTALPREYMCVCLAPGSLLWWQLCSNFFSLIAAVASRAGDADLQMIFLFFADKMWGALPRRWCGDALHLGRFASCAEVSCLRLTHIKFSASCFTVHCPAAFLFKPLQVFLHNAIRLQEMYHSQANFREIIITRYFWLFVLLANYLSNHWSDLNESVRMNSYNQIILRVNPVQNGRFR